MQYNLDRDLIKYKISICLEMSVFSIDIGNHEPLVRGLYTVRVDRMCI